MALMRGCHRCKTGYDLVITKTSTEDLGPLEVRLCAPCRRRADEENEAALARRNG